MVNKNPSLEQLISQQRQTILNVAHQHGAISVKLFGSVGRGQTTTNSDLDLLVQFEPGYSLLNIIALKQDLEDLLGFPVDIVTETALSPYIRQQVLAEAIAL